MFLKNCSPLRRSTFNPGIQLPETIFQPLIDCVDHYLSNGIVAMRQAAERMTPQPLKSVARFGSGILTRVLGNNAPLNDATVISPASKEHIPAIARLWKQLVDFHEDIEPSLVISDEFRAGIEDFLQESIDSSDSHVAIALDGETVIGFAMCDIRGYPEQFRPQKRGVISYCFVDPLRRGEGAGERLLEETIAWCKSQNVTRIEASMSPENPMIQKLCAKMGFKTYMINLLLDE